MAQILMSTLSFVFNIANGFIVPYPQLPPWWAWVNRAVPTTWVLYGLCTAQLGKLATPLALGGRALTAAGFLEGAFGWQYDMRWWCTLIVAANLLAYRVGSVLLLRHVSFLKR